MSKEVLFVRTDTRAYEVGPPSALAFFEPRANGKAGAAMIHALAAERGRSVRLTHLLPLRDVNGARSNPRACAWSIIGRAISQIGYTSPLLEIALQDFALWTERSHDGSLEVFGKLQGRTTNGVVIRT